MKGGGGRASGGMGDWSLGHAVWVAAAFLLGMAATLLLSTETSAGYLNTRAERSLVVYGGRDVTADGGDSDSGGGAGAVTPDGQTVIGPWPSPAMSAKYGFYLHVYTPAAAVIYQVKQIKAHFPGSPIYIMSDGGDRFDGLCQKEACTFKLCPPANDRWHPWPFLRRFYDAALALNAEYIIMLEPDNTVHRPILHPPTHDAGGLLDMNPKFGTEFVAHAEAIARKTKPGFNWTYTGSGLAGGAYFRRAAVLESFSDEAVSEIDWDFYMKHDSKRVFSSDFAMPIALSEKGYTYAPWAEVRQVEPTEDRMVGQPKDAAFQHYGRGVKGGKPTYNMRIESWQEDALVGERLEMHKHWNSNCQRCFNHTQYVALWGTDDCTNRYGYTWSPGVQLGNLYDKEPPSRPFYPVNK